MKKIISSLVFMICAFFAHSQCYQDRHNTSTDQAWLSCTKSVGPNPDRGNTHWIMYDFGDVYKLGKSTFWNLNNPDQLDAGIRDAYVDYSVDGTNWTQWGLLNLDQASASGFYEGEDGPDFEDLEARYLLITVIDNWGDVACSGFSELRIETNGLATSTEEQLLADLNITVSPNPSSDLAIVDISVEQAIQGIIQLTDMTGKVVSTKQADLHPGQNQITMDVSDHPAGQYLVSYIADNKSHSINLSIVHDK